MNGPHPIRQLLEEYVTGALPDESASELERHLAECRECEQTLDGLAAEDTVLSALRHPRPEDPLLEEPALDSALRR